MKRINISDVKSIIKNMHNTAKKLNPNSGNRLVSVMFEGGSGVGKTYATMDVAKEKNIVLSKIDAMNFNTPGDISGALLIKDGMSTAAPRKEFMKLMKVPRGKSGILLIDDVKRLHTQLLQEIMDLVMYGQIGTNRFLPANVFIVLTANPDTGMYYGNKMDVAQKTRTLRFLVEPNVIEWLRWGARNGINDKILEFISEYPMELNDSSDSSKNPRLWTLISKSIDTHSRNNNIVDAVIENNLPENHMFLSYFRNSEDGRIGLQKMNEWLSDGKYLNVIGELKNVVSNRGGIAEQHRLLRLMSIVVYQKNIPPNIVSKIFSSNALSAEMAVVYLRTMKDMKGFANMVVDKELSERMKKDNISI